jgi:hypothetical protein
MSWRDLRGLSGPDWRRGSGRRSPRIVRADAATEDIATSNGQNDSGLFELSFRDDFPEAWHRQPFRLTPLSPRP